VISKKLIGGKRQKARLRFNAVMKIAGGARMNGGDRVGKGGEDGEWRRAAGVNGAKEENFLLWELGALIDSREIRALEEN
jgi:hypothetical protein